MNVKNIHDHAAWFASYMNAPDGGSDAQGQALVECQIKKINQYKELIETIKGEIELCESPKEYDAEVVICSIKELLSKVGQVEHVVGYFKWIG